MAIRKRGRPTGKAPEGYVGYAEAVKLFSPLDRNAFSYRVRAGDIVVLEGKTKAYQVESILKTKEAILEERKAKQEVLIDWLYASDLPAGLKLVQSLYGPDIDLADLAIYQSWRKHNSRITMAAFSRDRQECFASIQVLPLDEQVILNILSGKRTESSILPDEVRSYDEPGPYTLLVTNATVLPDKPEMLYQILYRYTEFWIEQYPERYITRVYAQAVSERGDLLIQHFFMTPRYDLAKNAYMLDLARPGASKMVRLFQRRIREKTPLPTELQPDYTVPTPSDA